MSIFRSNRAANERWIGIDIPSDWICAVTSCGQRTDQPHAHDCPYAALDQGDRDRD